MRAGAFTYSGPLLDGSMHVLVVWHRVRGVRRRVRVLWRGRPPSTVPAGGARRALADGAADAGALPPGRPHLSTVVTWETPLLSPMVRKLPDSGQGALRLCLQLPPPR